MYLWIILSGGIDSSLVTALMVKNAKKPINTFSIGFENNNFDESQHARRVANHLGTVHFEKIIDNNDLFDSIQNFLRLMMNHLLIHQQYLL